ncbi:MAG TPA: serine/threonine-protein kinase [Gemmatimonadales bacterium]|nr:serine/threonine-protein kinase [Gemmatimonadales bacterium]
MSDPLERRFQALLQGRYAIERELGRGGMATVYLARDLRHGRQVAIKLLQPEITTSLTAERFLREITITAKLQHPNILTLFDSGAEEGLCYYVMPHVEGESLRDRLLWEKQLAVDTAIQVAIEVASALAYAHSHGVVHRDIKPENILFSTGHAIVADFGIARAVSEGQRSITAVGIPLGTPPYMSPEQAQGLENIDLRSDIYALACVLFEMVAGRPPFVGVSVGKVIQQHLLAPPPSVREFRAEAPEALDQILQRALAKDRTKRFQTADEMLEALRLVAALTTLERATPPGVKTPASVAAAAAAQAATLGTPEAAAAARTVGAGGGTPPPPPPPPAGGMNKLVLGVAGVLLAIGLGVGGYVALRRGGTPQVGVAVLRPAVSASEASLSQFGLAIVGDIESALQRLAGVRVVSSASVETLRNAGRSARQIADSLHVMYLVLGTVQSDGQTAHVTMQVVNAAEDNVVWSESYDYRVGELLAGQQQIAAKVAAAVGGRAKR